MAISWKGKVWQTPEGKKAIELISNKKTFGDQVQALAANRMLEPTKPAPKMGSQAYANQMAFRLILEDFLTKYEKWTTKDGKVWNIGAPAKAFVGTFQPYKDEWSELYCILTAPLGGAYDESMTKWYAFHGGTIQNVCKLAANRPSLTWPSAQPRTFDWAISHLAARDPKAASVLRQAYEGKMVQAAEESAASQITAGKEAAQKFVGDVVAAPAKAALWLMPTWLKWTLAVGGVALAYAAYRNRGRILKAAARTPAGRYLLPQD